MSANAPGERTGVTTVAGRPVTLLGPELAVGDRAPDFTVVGPDLEPLTFSSLRGRVRVVLAVPTLDTDPGDPQAGWFDEACAELGDDAIVLTVSADPPPALSRRPGAAGGARLHPLSDRDLSFGLAYGVVIKELRVLARAVFVVDPDDTVVHLDYSPAVEQLPNQELAVRAASGAGAHHLRAA